MEISAKYIYRWNILELILVELIPSIQMMESVDKAGMIIFVIQAVDFIA